MFNQIVNFSLHQRLFVLAGAVFLMVYGSLSLQHLSVDVFPDLNKPTVTLMTEAEGMAPEEVEQLVTFPLEAAMNGLPNVTRVRSVSGVGLSIVFVEFAWSTDNYRNRQQIAERLNIVIPQLPKGVVPQMGPVTSIMGEIMLIGMYAEDTSVSPMVVREFADWVVRPRLLTLAGVAQVIPIGGEVRQYHIVPNTQMMGDLKISLEQLEQSLSGFAVNTSGGFLEKQSREYLIRNLARTSRLEDLQNLVVTMRDNVPILLSQIAQVEFAPRLKRGDASLNAQPAVILSVQKQPNADTISLTRNIEQVLVELEKSAPKGVKTNNVLFKQANFIQASIGNVEEALRDAAIIVAIVLFWFLMSTRTTLISLIALPISMLIAVLVFKWLGLSINTMTLGGLAIAIGELVDDAVVDVENILRRLRSNYQLSSPRPILSVVLEASLEVRSGIVYATFIVILVFVPLFALSGIEGRLFAPLGIAYIVSIFASMLVSMTVTPVLCYYFLPNSSLVIHHKESWLIRHLKTLDTKLLHWSLKRGSFLLGLAGMSVVMAGMSVPFLPRAFLPAFNEGTLTISMLLNPGSSLSESNAVGTLAEQLIRQVPEVIKTGRRTGRAELDEHAEGVHSSEIDVDLRSSSRKREEILQDIRQRLAALPVTASIGQPISHRLDHLLSGVRAQVALKIFGDDLDTLQALAQQLYPRLQPVSGLVDLQIEKQTRIPQIQVRVDYHKATRYGITPAAVNNALETLIAGKTVAQIIENNRRFDIVLRVNEKDRTLQGLANVLIETPTGHVPLHLIAEIYDYSGPNQISRDNGRRRVVISANSDGSDVTAIVAKIREIIASTPLPEGYFVSLEGQFQAQEEATRLMSVLALIALIAIFLVLYSRYQSIVLALIIMVNIPLALVGSVIALTLAHQPLSVASLVGFITLAGISARNGILKISHYLHLMSHENEGFTINMIVRGSLERLTPVLMTALTAALALLPLVLAPDALGKEILHPIAVVIFGGLMSATVLDTLLTPIMFWYWGEKPAKHLLNLSFKENVT